MKRVAMLTTLLTVVVVMATPGWAEEMFKSVTVTPAQLLRGVDTTITVTVKVVDPKTFVPDSAVLQRQRSATEWESLGRFTLENRSSDTFEFTKFLKDPTPGRKTYRVAAAFVKEGREFSPEFDLETVDRVPPSTQDTVIQGPEGTGLSMTIAGGSLKTTVNAAITTAPPEAVPAVDQHFPRVATIEIILHPTRPLDGVILTKPVKISVPAPLGTPADARFLFAQPVRSPKLGKVQGLDNKLLARDTGIVSGGQIVSQGTTYAGVFDDTVLAILRVR